MSLPKIYSISTVGILKHFNQDFIIHPLRTDFTGGNGVGKSIIADLIQIIFICDEKNIKFGTDSFSKDKREIRKLPYKNSEAYAFLNVKVADDKFITIGVNIQAKSGRRIKPFLVLSNPDFKKPIAELAYDTSKILTHKDFLDEKNKIMPLDKLSRNLKESSGLYFSYFSFREEIEQYHSFLFSKEILPINLTIPEHLKAFAKVIQSFSKVKELGLDKANSLKEFLFEDDDKEYWEEYSKHQNQLDKLLTEFKDLNYRIDDIEKKQEALKKLENYENLMNDSEQKYKSQEIIDLHKEQLSQRKKEQKIRKKLEKKTTKRDKLEAKKGKFEKLEQKLEKHYTIIETNYTLLIQFASKFEEWKKYDSEISQLKKLSYSNFSKETINNALPIDFNEISTKEIIKRVNEAVPLFEQYGQLNDLTEKHEEQVKKLDFLVSETEKKLKHSKRIYKLLSEKDSESLFSQVIHKKKNLTLQQESVLLGLIDLSFKKPEKATKGYRYVLSTNILNENNFELDSQENGFWLKLGEIREFIEYPKEEEERLFNESSDFNNIISNKTDELKIQIDKLIQKETELDKIRKLKEYNHEIVDEYEFDIRLLEYSKIEALKEVVWIICNKGEKVSNLISDSSELKRDLDEIEQNITVPVATNKLSEQIQDYAIRKKIANNRKKTVTTKRNEEVNELSGLNGELPYLQKNLTDIEKRISESSELYATEVKSFSNKYPDVDLNSLYELSVSDNISELKFDFEENERDFITEYKSISNSFDETKDNKNSQVNLQIEKNLYQFEILEEVILGGKIKHRDNISGYLREANEQRLRIVDNIRDNMIKVFSKTLSRFSTYENIVKNLNTFFIGKKISDAYYLNLNFHEYDNMKISWIEDLQLSAQWVNNPGELEFGTSVQQFIEKLFKKLTGIRRAIEFKDLLNPKSYFDLDITLTDEFKNEIPGSTGETYSAIVLLGIARLSKVQEKKRKGLRFIILEELANLDSTNFNVFPEIAKEYNYQILTMTPKPYNSDSEDGWYLYHLIKGKEDININYPVPASYYKTRGSREDLKNYLIALER